MYPQRFKLGEPVPGRQYLFFADAMRGRWKRGWRKIIATTDAEPVKPFDDAPCACKHVGRYVSVVLAVDLVTEREWYACENCRRNYLFGDDERRARVRKRGHRHVEVLP